MYSTRFDSDCICCNRSFVGRNASLTIKDLLAEFPEYRPTFYHVDMKNKIEPHYTWHDRLELEGMLLDRQNNNRLQGELFYE